VVGVKAGSTASGAAVTGLVAPSPASAPCHRASPCVSGAVTTWEWPARTGMPHRFYDCIQHRVISYATPSHTVGKHGGAECAGDVRALASYRALCYSRLLTSSESGRVVGCRAAPPDSLRVRVSCDRDGPLLTSGGSDMKVA
jgi:hypothetical protein